MSAADETGPELFMVVDQQRCPVPGLTGITSRKVAQEHADDLNAKITPYYVVTDIVAMTT